MQKLVRCFMDVDLRCQHDGLTKLAAKHKVFIRTMKPGQHYVFINKAMNKIKMLSFGNVLSYYKQDKGKISLETLRHIPDAFTGGQIDVAYSDALEKLVKQKLNKQGL